MESYWYYTLSAIPQTLAAMVALSATFFVFRLNFISEEIKKNRKDLLRFTLLLAAEQGEIDIIEQKTEEEFLEFYKEVLKKIKPDQPNLGLGENQIYEKLATEMQRIISEDWRSYFRAKPERVARYLHTKRKLLENLLSIKKMAKRLFGCTLLTTTFVVTVSLLALPNYDIIRYPRTIVYIILSCSLVSVILTAYSVWKIATTRIAPEPDLRASN